MPIKRLKAWLAVRRPHPAVGAPSPPISHTEESPPSVFGDISILFDPQFYAERYGVDPEGQMSEADLFLHWKTLGRQQNMDPHPLFSVEYYTAGQEAAEFDATDPITHFLSSKSSSRRSPHPLFDAKWYSATYTDVKRSGANPLVHYLQFGHKEGRRPSPMFDGNWYLKHYGDVREAGLNPLVHYALFGKAEGRYRSEIDLEAAEASKRGAARPRNLGDGYRLPRPAQLTISRPNPVQSGPSLLPLAADLTQSKLLSVDIWDTTLYRRCHPDEIKIASARLLYVDHRWRLRVAYRDVMSLYRARRLSEDESSLTSDFEYRFEDAALRWVERVFEEGTPTATLQAVVRQLMRYELQVEVRACYSNGAMADFLRQERHPPVAFVSDFYMPGKFMLELLRAKGLGDSFVKLYCSSDYAENKRSGRLFSRVVGEFGLTPSEVFHIGDNAKADVQSPQSQGIRTHHYRSPAHELERSRADKLLNARLNSDVVPLNLALVDRLYQRSNTLNGDASDRTAALKRLGNNVAPLAIGLILHIIEQSRLYAIKKIFFFTREGIFFKKLYDAVVAQDPYGCAYPESVLLDVSRIATFAPSMHHWNEPELMRMWSLYSTQSPAAFVRSLNLDPDAAKRLFHRAGVGFNTSLEYPWLHKGFMGTVQSEEFERLARQSISEQRQLLCDYLAQRGFDVADKINVVVDVGWRGSIQDNLSKLCSGHLHGCYLGLFSFLNPQPQNTSKSAWLFDFNISRPQIEAVEVAPIEMLFNGLGGSVSGYSRSSDGLVRSVKTPSEAEDRIFHSATRWIQDGILESVDDCVDFASIHGCTADDLLHAGWNAFEGLLQNPTQEFASAFFGLAHNEVFGTGGFYTNDSLAAMVSSISRSRGALLHGEVSEQLAKIRWTAGMAALPEVSKAIAAIGSEARHLPSILSKAVATGKTACPGLARVGFVIPAPIVGSGGHRTIFKLVRQFALRGCEVFCYLESEGDGIHVAKEMLGDVNAYIYPGWDQAADLDVVFATIAHSASFVADMPNAKMKCYLVQDYEALFNPIGDRYTIAENSYTFGLKHFTIGNWLTHVLARQHAATAIPSGLGIDLSTYFVRPKSRREPAICFLYQPEKPRRNGLLGIEAIRLVKEQLPSTKVYVYGSNTELELDFEAEQLGLIRDLSDLNALYNRCAVGLCISMSNPSRIPFEMMAAGTVPVDVYRYNNLFDYLPGTALLAHQSAPSVAHAILSLLQDKFLLNTRRQRCVGFAKGRSMEWEADVIVNSVVQALSGTPITGESAEMSYVDDPIIAPAERTAEILGFCEWQRHLAMSVPSRPMDTSVVDGSTYRAKAG